jgi:hypothetical protein
MHALGDHDGEDGHDPRGVVRDSAANLHVAEPVEETARALTRT